MARLCQPIILCDVCLILPVRSHQDILNFSICLCYSQPVCLLEVFSSSLEVQFCSCAAFISLRFAAGIEVIVASSQVHMFAPCAASCFSFSSGFSGMVWFRLKPLPLLGHATHLKSPYDSLKSSSGSLGSQISTKDLCQVKRRSCLIPWHFCHCHMM